MLTRKILNISSLPPTTTYQPYSNNCEEQKPLQQQYSNQQEQQHIGNNRQRNNLTKLRNFFIQIRIKSTSVLSALHTQHQQHQQQSKRHHYRHGKLIVCNNNIPIVQSTTISSTLNIVCIVVTLVLFASINGVTSSSVFVDNSSLAQYSDTTTKPASISATTTTKQAGNTTEAAEKVLPTTTTTSSTTEKPRPTTITITPKSTATPTPATTHQPVLTSTNHIYGLATWAPVTSQTPSNAKNKLKEPPSEDVDVPVSYRVSAVTSNTTVLKSLTQKSVRIPKYTIIASNFAPVGTPTTTPRSGVSYPGQTAQVCGRRMYRQPRMYGGFEASFGRWPWQVSLLRRDTLIYSHTCGATLLNENWAITAAHCVDKKLPSNFLLRMGQFNLAAVREPYGYQERQVKAVVPHPKFSSATFEYDLALLKFNEPVVFQPNIVPVCLPETNETFFGETGFVTGWGTRYKKSGTFFNVLREAPLPVINNTICESMYNEAGNPQHIPYIFICAGWKDGRHDTCEGDSGGPSVLQRKSDQRFQLIGITSWGIGCGNPNEPSGYTRVSEFRHWINQIIQF